MAVKQTIIDEIKELFKDAPPGTSKYFLKHFDQIDVMDTVNNLHIEHPRSIQYVEEMPNDYLDQVEIVLIKLESN